MFRPSQYVQKAVARVDSIPAPIGGWNARDSLADMAPTDAIYMKNLFPSTSSVNLRGGSTAYATGMNGAVQTLMIYAGGSTEKMFAISAGDKAIFDVTSGGAVGAAVVTGLTNAWWEYTNITTPGGHFMYAANGVDKPLLYDGSTWNAIDGSGSPAITGVTTTTLQMPFLHQSRIWFIQKNTLTLWYLPTDSVGGAAQELDLSSICRLGGYLVAINSWTIDAGYGMDDMLVAITNMGEIIIYRGTDPASASTWALVGVWALGAPVTARCMLKYGGDLLVNTLDGLLPLAASLQSDRLDPRVALSNKIQNAISIASSNYGTTLGWEIFYYPASNAVWVNVPVDGGSFQQYVMNTITQSWCSFTGWNASCWELYNNLPYFGGIGKVYLAWDSTYADSGAQINATTLQAFNYFGQRGIEKYFTRARPAIFTSGTPSINIGMNVDYDLENTATALTFSGNSVAKWDVAKWDQGYWGSDAVITNNWQGISGVGYCGAILLNSASIGIEIMWASTDVVYQAGWAGI
jgi:hypothetical protein